MITVTQIDSNPPPTWDGTLPGPPVTNPATRVRFTLGHEFDNYLVSQRREGDLFARDVLLGQSILALIDNLSTRGGHTYTLPETAICLNSEIVVARFSVSSPSVRGWVNSMNVWASSNKNQVFLSLYAADVNGAKTGSAIISADAEGSFWTTASDGDRGEELNVGSYVLILENNSGVDLLSSANFIWRPSNV